MTDASATSRPYADWTTEQLIEFEQSLYDDEVNGEDTWFVRDQVLWELNYRNFGAEKPRPSDD